MSYCPPSSSKWAPADPFRKTKPAVDADGWQTVAAKTSSAGAGTSATSTTAVKNKWGESALKKPAPKFEDEFPTLGGCGGGKAVAAVAAVAVGGAGAPAAPAAIAAAATPRPPVSFADRLKHRMAEEEADRLRLAEEERMKAEREQEQYEKNRYSVGEVMPLTSFMRSRMARNFKVEHEDEYHDPAMDAEYYNEYPDHYYEERAAPYDYAEDVYEHNSNNHNNNSNSNDDYDDDYDRDNYRY